ncbi:MAG: helix-turn-helix transcriptional regulator [Acidimicrobiia bacterium]
MQNVVERVINLLIYLLDSPSPVTADQVRQTVAGYGEQSDDAFHRMFERDKDLLKRMGIPLELRPTDKWEIDFGYTVDPNEYAIPDPGLNEQERVALSVAARMVRLGGTNAGLAGLLKLGGVEVGAGIEPLAADLGAEATVLGDLFLAVSERRKLEFEYGGSNRLLDPYGIAHRRGHWYLIGQTADGERVYRVDRISHLDVGKQGGAFVRPKRFQVKRAMSKHPWEAGTDETVHATVRFDPDVAWWAARHLGVDVPGDDYLEVELAVANRDAFIGWVLGFGPDAEVLAPTELRQEVLARVEAAVEAAR